MTNRRVLPVTESLCCGSMRQYAGPLAPVSRRWNGAGLPRAIRAKRGLALLSGLCEDLLRMPSLNWIGKEADVKRHHKAPFRLLRDVPELACGDPGSLDEGAFQFQKHYHGPRPGDLREKRADGKLAEEFRWDCSLDSLAAVRWWARNLANKSSSFRLQTSQFWFYPDFVSQLTDGRMLAVKYKGAHLWKGAEEKRAVGAVWESRSGGCPARRFRP